LKLLYFIITILIVCLCICVYTIIKQKKHIKQIENMSSRYNTYYNLLNQWMKNKAQNKKIVDYLMKNGIKTVAVYGIGEVGQLLYEELKGEQVQILYFIESSGGNSKEDRYGKRVIGVKEINKQEKADAIIITPIYNFESIYNGLVDENVDTIVLSLEDIIYGQK
jgi:lactate dehydrogenase-like 2-hydroxyacid dehydrogenase